MCEYTHMQDAIQTIKNLLNKNLKTSAILFLMDRGLTHKTACTMVQEIEAGAPWYN